MPRGRRWTPGLRRTRRYTDMDDAWKQKVRRVRPYTPGLQPAADASLIKLNTNECPYPPSPKVAEALAHFDAGTLRLYPAPDADALTEALAHYHGVKKEQVFTGVGSDEVLALAFLTFFAGEGKEQRPVFFPDVTYSFYEVWASLFRIPFETKALREDFTIDPADYADAPGGVVLANPNAPTALAAPLSLIEEIVKQNPGTVVIIDEAYIDFGGETALPLLAKYDNLLVTRTFSKSRAMAGMRIGYAIGNEALIAHLKNTKFAFNSYTMSRVAIEAGIAAVEDEAYFLETIKKVKATRERLAQALSALGFTFPPSSANFLFVTHPRAEAKRLYEDLVKEKIYVRYFAAPRTKDYLRITVGTDHEADALLNFLRAYPALN